jgi:formylglycine-generating enzyme required for sulfatase activity
MAKSLSDLFKVLRGGSYLSFPRICRSACRDLGRPDGAVISVGFRVRCLLVKQ